MVSALSKMSIKKRINIINGFYSRENSPYYASVTDSVNSGPVMRQ